MCVRVHVCVHALVMEGRGVVVRHAPRLLPQQQQEMGQRVAMAPRSQGQREGPGGWLIPAICVLIMNGVFVSVCVCMND